MSVCSKNQQKPRCPPFILTGLESSLLDGFWRSDGNNAHRSNAHFCPCCTNLSDGSRNEHLHYQLLCVPATWVAEETLQQQNCTYGSITCWVSGTGTLCQSAIWIIIIGLTWCICFGANSNSGVLHLESPLSQHNAATQELLPTFSWV